MRPRTFFLFLAAGLIAGMFLVASAGALEPPTHPAEASTGKASAPKESADLQGPAAGSATEVSAGDLWASYFRDAAGADRLYRGRSLVVTGDIRALERNYEGQMVVRLSAGHEFDTVNATLRAGNEQIVGALAKGHAVSLLCVGRGAVMGAPLLAGCLVR
jgi:hypothetical protein